MDINEKIEKARQKLEKARSRYDSIEAEYKALQAKRDESRRKMLMEAIGKSRRTFDELCIWLEDRFEIL